MEMAPEDECNNTYASLRKAETKELSVLAIFQKILMILLCCMTSPGITAVDWQSFIHASVRSQISLHVFFEVGQEFSKSRGNS